MLKKMIVMSVFIIGLLNLDVNMMLGTAFADTTKKAQPQKTNNKDIQSENLFLFQKDTVMQGVDQRKEYYFQINDSRHIVDGSYIQLNLSHSGTLLSSKSTITVMFDNVPLRSEYLTENNKDEQVWKIPLKQLDLKPGYHEISILTHMEVTNNLCQDQTNLANWLRLDKKSLIHLNYLFNYNQYSLRWYPSPFLKIGSPTPLNTIFVIPDQAETSDIEAMAKIARSFSQLSGNTFVTYEAYHLSDVTKQQLDHSNIIMVGSKNEWTNSFVSQTNNFRDASISIEQSPWNNQKVLLMVTGKADQKLRAADILSNPKLYSQLQGSEVAIPAKLNIPSEQTDILGLHSNTFTLKQLGYKDLVVQNNRVGQEEISYNVPKAWNIKSGVDVTLLYHHSKTLDFSQSLIDVTVNGVPLGNKYLKEATSEHGVFRVHIPQSIVDQSETLNIVVSFQFGHKQQACEDRIQMGNWAVINDNSSLAFSYTPTTRIDLGNLPYPFVTLNHWGNTTVLLPDHMTSAALSLLDTIVGFVGNQASMEDVAFIRSNSANPDKIKNSHLIYVGASKDIPNFLNQSNKSLIQLNKNGSEIIPNKKVTLLDNLRKNVGFFELFHSPLNTSKLALVVSGTNTNAIVELNQIMKDSNIRNQIHGKLSIVDEAHRVHSFAMEKLSRPTTKDRVLEFFHISTKAMMSRVMFIIYFIAILTVVSILLWVFRKRK